MRDHKAKASQHADGAEAEGQNPNIKNAQMSRMMARKQIRSELREFASNAASAIDKGALLFSMMVRGDDEKKLQEEMEPHIAETIKEKVLDKIFDKLKEGLSAVADVGEHVASGAAKTFSVVKSVVDKKIAQQQKMTLLQVADAVSQALADRALEMKHDLWATIDKIQPAELLAAGKVLADAQEEGENAADQDDSDDRGDLGQGMRAQAAVSLLGLPAGDLVAAEDVALAAYGTFRTSVGAAGTAAEQVDAAQDAMANPGADKKKLEKVEGHMGDKFKHDLQRDKTMRARTAEVRS